MDSWCKEIDTIPNDVHDELAELIKTPFQRGSPYVSSASSFVRVVK
jgi:hypothetical protein